MLALYMSSFDIICESRAASMAECLCLTTAQGAGLAPVRLLYMIANLPQSQQITIECWLAKK